MMIQSKLYGMVFYWVFFLFFLPIFGGFMLNLKAKMKHVDWLESFELILQGKWFRQLVGCSMVYN